MEERFLEEENKIVRSQMSQKNLKTIEAEKAAFLEFLVIIFLIRETLNFMLYGDHEQPQINLNKVRGLDSRDQSRSRLRTLSC